MNKAIAIHATTCPECPGTILRDQDIYLTDTSFRCAECETKALHIERCVDCDNPLTGTFTTPGVNYCWNCATKPRRTHPNYQLTPKGTYGGYVGDNKVWYHPTEGFHSDPKPWVDTNGTRYSDQQLEAWQEAHLLALWGDGGT